MCVRERECVCICVSVCVSERERERVCVSRSITASLTRVRNPSSFFSPGETSTEPRCRETTSHQTDERRLA